MPLQIRKRRLRVDGGPGFRSTLLAMVGTRRFKDAEEASKKIPKLRDSFTLCEKTSARYQELFQSIKILYPAMAERVGMLK